MPWPQALAWATLRAFVLGFLDYCIMAILDAIDWIKAEEKEEVRILNTWAIGWVIMAVWFTTVLDLLIIPTLPSSAGKPANPTVDLASQAPVPTVVADAEESIAKKKKGLCIPKSLANTEQDAMSRAVERDTVSVDDMYNQSNAGITTMPGPDLARSIETVEQERHDAVQNRDNAIKKLKDIQDQFEGERLRLKTELAAAKRATIRAAHSLFDRQPVPMLRMARIEEKPEKDGKSWRKHYEVMVDDVNQITIQNEGPTKGFQFDYVFDISARNEDISSFLAPMVDAVSNGHSGYMVFGGCPTGSRASAMRAVIVEAGRKLLAKGILSVTCSRRGLVGLLEEDLPSPGPDTLKSWEIEKQDSKNPKWPFYNVSTEKSLVHLLEHFIKDENSSNDLYPSSHLMVDLAIKGPIEKRFKTLKFIYVSREESANAPVGSALYKELKQYVYTKEGLKNFKIFYEPRTQTPSVVLLSHFDIHHPRGTTQTMLEAACSIHDGATPT